MRRSGGMRLQCFSSSAYTPTGSEPRDWNGLPGLPLDGDAPFAPAVDQISVPNHVGRPRCARQRQGGTPQRNWPDTGLGRLCSHSAVAPSASLDRHPVGVQWVVAGRRARRCTAVAASRRPTRRNAIAVPRPARTRALGPSGPGSGGPGFGRQTARRVWLAVENEDRRPLFVIEKAPGERHGSARFRRPARVLGVGPASGERDW